MDRVGRARAASTSPWASRSTRLTPTNAEHETARDVVEPVGIEDRGPTFETSAADELGKPACDPICLGGKNKEPPSRGRRGQTEEASRDLSGEERRANRGEDVSESVGGPRIQLGKCLVDLHLTWEGAPVSPSCCRNDYNVVECPDQVRDLRVKKRIFRQEIEGVGAREENESWSDLHAM